MENLETLAWLIAAEFVDTYCEVLLERIEAEPEAEPLTMSASA